MNTLGQDFRYGLRTLRGRPGFTAVAVAVLALGIGANTAVFSLVNAFLLKPLHLEKADELVGCYSREIHKPDSYRAFSYPNYVDLRDGNKVFANLMAHNMAMVGLAEGSITRRVFADIVSSNYFSTLGVPLFRGRSFTAAEERPDANIPVAIVSHSYWKKTGSDPNLLGKTIRVNGQMFTVVGITQPGFSGTTALVSSELYLPLGVYTLAINDFVGHVRSLAARDNNNLILVGRVRPGLMPKEVDAQLAVVATQLERAFPAENRDQTFIARPLSRLSVSTQPSSDKDLATPAILLLSMASVVLLIASLNLANMMLARGNARRTEIAIRLAIGGGRVRIIRQLVTEALILATLGGAAGLLVSSWSTSLLMSSLARLAPLDLIYSPSPDLRVLLMTMALCLASTVLFGLGPAWKLSKPDVISDLRKNSTGDAGGGRGRLFSRRNLLVMAQLSLSLMMLTAAGLFVQSAFRAAHIHPGFSLSNQALAEVDPSLAGYDQVRGRQMYDALLGRLQSVPGVESVAFAATVPFGMTSLGRSMRPAENAGADKNTPAVGATLNIVTGDYFKTLGIPLVRGRSFLAGETAAGTQRHVAIVDQLAATRLWPNAEPVGKRIRFEAGEPGKAPEELEIVGIAGNVQDHIIGRGDQPHIYIPFGQIYQSNMQIHLKMAVPGRDAQARVLEAIRTEIRAVDSRIPLLALRSLEDHLDASLDLWIVRTGARILGIFGAVALLLAVIGLYGVKAYTVSQRTRELGIRMALGADAADNLRMILREGMGVTAVGVAIGMALSLGLAQVLAGLVYEVHAVDPVVLSATPVLLAAVSLVACYLPARKASRVDPMVALRCE